MNKMDTIQAAGVKPMLAVRPGQVDETQLSPHERIENRLEREVEAMTLYALASGLGVPADTIANVDLALPGIASADPMPANPDAPAPRCTRVTALAEAHLSLTKLIAPAKPGSILLLVEQRRGHLGWQTFGAVPLVRSMQAIAVISLLVLLGISLSDRVNAENMTKGLLNLYGLDLFCVEVFLVAAAAVGASLTNLRRLDRYIVSCTYEQRFDSSYWSRLVMGVISGIILSQVVYSALVGSQPDANSTLSAFGQPVLALLGGFSADLVHDILNQFISVFGNLLAGKGQRRPEPETPPLPRPPGS
jgi:hypothetical protein